MDSQNRLEGWDEREISADEDGFKPEEEVRRELTAAIRNLALGENPLRIHDLGPGTDGHDKKESCAVSFHFAYTLAIADRGDQRRYRPWIIASTSFPQIVFEMRVSMSWVGPSTYGRLVPEPRRAEPAQATKTTAQKKPSGPKPKESAPAPRKPGRG